jgi:hypothetical protein
MDQKAKNVPPPGALPFALLFTCLALLLLSQLGAETKFSAKGQLVAQPAFWPAIGVIGMVLFGGFHLLTTYLHRQRADGPPGDFPEVGVWLRSLEYLAWFMVYVFAVPVIGYLPATLLFTVALAFRVGYRSPGQLGLVALTGLGIVLVFKSLLAVKIPGGAIYDYLPDTLRSIAIGYL